MDNEKLIQATDPNVDTLKCPSCGVLWRSKGYYNFDEGGGVHEEDECPSGCLSSFLRLPIYGKIVPR